jgi:hypothetical protein
MLAPVIGPVVISEADARTYVEKHVSYGELAGARE